MSQTIEVSTREAQIAGVVQMFEDRLTSRPGSPAWAELSRMLQGAPPWRKELSSRWADREDWKAFLAWEIDYRSERWNKNSLPVGFSKPIRPRAAQCGAARHLAGYDIEARRVSARKVEVRAIADNGQVYSDTLNDSAPDEDLQDLAEQYAAAPSEPELLAMLQPEERILVEFTPGVRAFVPVVEYLDDEIVIVEWEQPGAGRVRGAVQRTDETNDNGEPVWEWDGTFEPVEEAAS